MRALVLATAFLLAACADLPDYARPQVQTGDPRAAGPIDSIRYRTVTRADFRATAPPRDIGAHAARMGAFTCGHVVAEDPIAIRIEPEGRGFVARAPGLVVYSEMDRGCSWWNDDLRDAQPVEYLLQHEQIHFAIFELVAREMQARGRAITARGDTVEAAHAAFQRALEELQQDVAKRLLERTTAFDRETSGVFRPDRQQRWYDRVRAELAH
jgi:hypothetical protein